MPHVSKLSALALAALGAACGADVPDAPPAEVRDSAGIRIVESRVPGGVAPIYAELGDVQLQIGVLEGDPAYAFENVVGIASLPDGDIVVAEGGRARELRIYDAAGRHVRSLGGPGGGPGEFGSLSRLVGVTGDTLRVWDSRNQRITTFRSNGDLLGDVRWERRFTEVTYRSDGSYLVRWRNAGDAAVAGEITRTSDVVGRVDARGEVIDTVAVVPGLVMQSSPPRTLTTADGAVAFAISILEPPVPHASFVAVGGDQIFTGYNERYRIEGWTPSGVADQVILASDLERALAPAEVESIRGSLIDRCDASDSCIANVDRMFEIFEPPELRPAFSALMVDALGDLWVAEWEHDDAAVSGWHVFSPDGELLGRVGTPPGLTVYEIGDDYLLGVVTDELDVPFVRRYGLTRLR